MTRSRPLSVRPVDAPIDDTAGVLGMASLSTPGLTDASPEVFFGENHSGQALASCLGVPASRAAMVEPTRPAGTPFTQRHIPSLHFTAGKVPALHRWEGSQATCSGLENGMGIVLHLEVQT